MSTNKPKIVIYSDNETIEYLDIIASENNRSRGNMADTIIKEYIKEYKSTHKELKSLSSPEEEIRKQA